MASTDNLLPKIQIKRRIEDLLVDTYGYQLIDAAPEGGTAVEAWILEVDDEYEPVGMNRQKFQCTTTVNLAFFAERDEAGVHEAVQRMMTLTPADFPGLTVKIMDVIPLNSTSAYGSESTPGLVIGTVMIQFSYYYTRGAN